MDALSDALLTARSALRPPPRFSLSEWAEQHAYLSPETSSEPGKFHAFAYQIAIMDAMTDPSIEIITVMKSARVGYTRLLDHLVGYHIHHDPAPVLVVQPRVEDAEDYSRTEIAPMLRDTPCLAAIAGDLKAKDSDQRILKRMFRNGASVSFVGANSPAGFRRITARVVCFDEVDAYPVEGAGEEGDQVKLGIKRSETFWNRKIVLGSTPLVTETSRIARSYAESDRRRYHVPCPHCGVFQTLKWPNLQWGKDIDANGNTLTHYPETAHFVCEGCQERIEEHHKPAMVAAGQWIAERPFKGHAGFHIWAAYSLWPNAAWSNLAREHLAAGKDRGLRKTFTNLVLGETWDEQYETVDGNQLRLRGENYGTDCLPDAIQTLTAGIDTHDDRFELIVLGFGAQEETWVVDFQVPYGDPGQQSAWIGLDQLLLREYNTDRGRTLRIKAVCIDSGGHHAQSVVNFCQSRRARRIYAIKGISGASKQPIWPLHASRTHTNQQVFLINVDKAKQLIYARLRNDKSGPNFMHFPAGEPYGEEFFDQLTSERVITKYKMGIPFHVWELPPNRNNEVLDCCAYAIAARESMPWLRFDTMVAAPHPHAPGERPPSPFPGPTSEAMQERAARLAKLLAQ
jgi:phage terminase large subunit GpA-like protein